MGNFSGQRSRFSIISFIYITSGKSDDQREVSAVMIWFVIPFSLLISVCGIPLTKEGEISLLCCA